MNSTRSAPSVAPFDALLLKAEADPAVAEPALFVDLAGQAFEELLSLGSGPGDDLSIHDAEEDS